MTISISSFSLIWLKDGEVVAEYRADGKTKEEILHWVHNQVKEADLDASKLHYIDHYEVPVHPVDEGAPFIMPESDILTAWMTHRTNANAMLAELNRLVGKESTIRIWPHHFDTGTYYPFGDKKSIGAGWAIGDAMCEYPYLYIYPWNADETVDLSDVPTLNAGRWMTDGWIGALLPLDEMQQMSELQEQLSDLMGSVTKRLKRKLKINERQFYYETILS